MTNELDEDTSIEPIMDTEKIPTENLVDILFSLLLLSIFIYLYDQSSGYPERAKLFPSIVLLTAILLVGILIAMKIADIFQIFEYESSSDEVESHLAGSEHMLSPRETFVRLIYTAAIIALFFLIAAYNVLVALAICYPLLAYSLGERNIKSLALATIIFVGFVYVVFIMIVGIPLGVF